MSCKHMTFGVEGFRGTIEVPLLCGLCSKDREDAAKEAAAAEERARILRMDQTWSLPDVVRTLRDAVGHLLDDHDCDAHGHEERRRAVVEATTWLGTIERGEHLEKKT